MVSAKDHKQIYDENKGPNTGGMGTISPNPFMPEGMDEVLNEEILVTTTSDNLRPLELIVLIFCPLAPLIIKYPPTHTATMNKNTIVKTSNFINPLLFIINT
jgi:hypothetical protein